MLQIKDTHYVGDKGHPLCWTLRIPIMLDIKDTHYVGDEGHTLSSQ